MRNHYKWLERNFKKFCELLNTPYYAGAESAHGDKCYSYKDLWEKSGITFEHGVAIYLLTYQPPYSQRVRETKNGWVDPSNWIIETYPEFKLFLDQLEKPE